MMRPVEGGCYVNDARIYNALLAGVVLALRCGQRSGWNDDHIAGVLALAEYQALTFNLSWPAMLCEIKQSLGADVAGLLDKAAAGGILEAK